MQRVAIRSSEAELGGGARSSEASSLLGQAGSCSAQEHEMRPPRMGSRNRARGTRAAVRHVLDAGAEYRARQRVAVNRQLSRVGHTCQRGVGEIARHADRSLSECVPRDWPSTGDVAGRDTSGGSPGGCFPLQGAHPALPAWSLSASRGISSTQTGVKAARARHRRGALVALHAPRPLPRRHAVCQLAGQPASPGSRRSKTT